MDVTREQTRTNDPPFRMDNDCLAFRFTATLTDRQGESIERLPTPARLADWLRANDLFDPTMAPPTSQDLAEALDLREAIHAAGTAVAIGRAVHEEDARVINEAARGAVGYPQLAEGSETWVTAEAAPVRSALGKIAHAAVAVLGGPMRQRVKRCEDPRCAGLYVDTSRGQNRRWCSMDFCGNRAKKARFRSPHRNVNT